MNVYLRRHPGWFGRCVPLDIVVNNARVSAIEANEILTISLPPEGGTLRVEMQGAVSSPAFAITPTQDGRTFECGTSWWVPLDVLSLLYSPFLKARVFYVRPAKNF